MKYPLNKKILLWTSSLALVDLIIKIALVKTRGYHNPIKIIGEYVWIIAVQNVAVPQPIGFPIWKVAGILFMLSFMFVTFKIQTSAVSNGFKVTSAMIVFAWIGKHLDHFILASENTIPESYGNMDWFYASMITESVISITTIMMNCGTVFFIILAIIKFKELRSVFAKS